MTINQSVLNTLYGSSIENIHIDFLMKQISLLVKTVSNNVVLFHNIHFCNVTKFELTNNIQFGGPATFEEILNISESNKFLDFDDTHLEYDYCIDGDFFEVYIKSDIAKIESL